MVALVARWLTDQVLVYVTASSFAFFVLLDQVNRLKYVSSITRLRMDAQLYNFAPERKPGQGSRPRIKGAPCPASAQRLNAAKTKCAKLEIKN